MAGLCEGGNESPGSLKASKCFLEKRGESFTTAVVRTKAMSFHPQFDTKRLADRCYISQNVYKNVQPALSLTENV
ncbi:hypothetical protein ANN_20365 [Periplaneta americana]|uniref:Uncharacterized protein n=1 Tax=Periplaneta americana TaxID=6978 RepID=A0ABQ8SDJ9_PERAM|nr:hypothetical protein ANN_20365 [Periplaneta americana]